MTTITQQEECQAIRDKRRPCKEFAGPKMYCGCGCMSPVNLSYDLTGVMVSGRAPSGYADYTLVRDGARVGAVNTQYATIILDGVEYLSVSKTSPLFRLVQTAKNSNAPKNATSIADVTMYAEVKDTTEQDMDRRGADHPGYCRKCHTYCYGDCEA